MKNGLVHLSGKISGGKSSLSPSLTPHTSSTYVEWKWLDKQVLFYLQSTYLYKTRKDNHNRKLKSTLFEKIKKVLK